MDADERERQAVAVLLRWPSESSGVLVGGYAVAAYAPARYSEDVDLVVLRDARTLWEQWLSEAGLRRERLCRLPAAEGVAPEVGRWKSGGLHVDLMSGGVRDSETGAVLPEAWLVRNPTRVRLELISGRLEAPVSVARLEAIWAMKLVAGRPQDLTDLYSMAGRPVDLTSIRELLTAISSPSLRRKFNRVLQTLQDRKQYADSLSRLRLGSPSANSNLASWRRFVSLVRRALPGAIDHGREA